MASDQFFGCIQVANTTWVGQWTAFIHLLFIPRLLYVLIVVRSAIILFTTYSAAKIILSIFRARLLLLWWFFAVLVVVALSFCTSGISENKHSQSLVVCVSVCVSIYMYASICFIFRLAAAEWRKWGIKCAAGWWQQAKWTIIFVNYEGTLWLSCKPIK